jgi:GDP-L-fucose synthase
LILVIVASGVDCTIAELAHTLAKVVKFKGNVVFDITKPDGAPRKLIDVSRLGDMGWQAQTSLEEGLCKIYAWFLENQSDIRL